MYALGYILPCTIVCCSKCFHERHSHKLAWPIGWLTSYEGKYYLLCTGKWLLKDNEPFLRNLSCNIEGIFHHIRCFLITMFLLTRVWQTSAASWLISCEKEKEMYHWIITKGFLRKVTSRMVFSGISLAIPCHARLLAVIDTSIKLARPICWLASCERKHCLTCTWKRCKQFGGNLFLRYLFHAICERYFVISAVADIDVFMNATLTK